MSEIVLSGLDCSGFVLKEEGGRRAGGEGRVPYMPRPRGKQRG